jgi:hypothetical protein
MQSEGALLDLAIGRKQTTFHITLQIPRPTRTQPALAGSDRYVSLRLPRSRTRIWNGGIRSRWKFVAGNGLIWARELILYTLCILSWMYGRGENGKELSALGWRLLFVHWGGYGIV